MKFTAPLIDGESVHDALNFHFLQEIVRRLVQEPGFLAPAPKFGVRMSHFLNYY